MEGGRTFCVGLVLYRNAKIPKAWVLTGCMWAELTPATMSDMVRTARQWVSEGYICRLECIALKSSHIVIHTTYIRMLQRAWRRQWRRRIFRWLRTRPITGSRRARIFSSHTRKL